MPNVAHIAIVNAYEINEKNGGGYRGVFFICETKERRASERFDTLEQAKYWAKMQAHETYGAGGYSLAPMRRTNEFYANVWVQV